MAVEAIKRGKIDDSNIKIEMKSNKAPTKFFRVPEQKADEFCRQYAKRDKKDSFMSNAVFIASAIVGCLLTTPLVNRISNSFLRIAVGASGGIITATLANIARLNNVEKNYQNFLAGFNATEIKKETLMDKLNSK